MSGNEQQVPDLELWHMAWKVEAEVIAGQIDESRIHRNPDGSIDRETTDIDTQLRLARVNTIAEVLNSLGTLVAIEMVQSEAPKPEQQ